MKQKTAQLLVSLFEAIGRDSRKGDIQTRIKTLIPIWEIALEDLSDQQIGEGLKNFIKQNTSTLIPAPGEFRSYCPGAKILNPEELAREAWNQLWKAVEGIGGGVSICFKDSCIAEAVRKIGGWERVCNCLEDEKNFLKKDFIQQYATAKQSGKNFDPLLSGYYDRINHSNGHNSKYLRHFGFEKEELAQIATSDEKRVLAYQQTLDSQKALPAPELETEYVKPTKEQAVKNFGLLLDHLKSHEKESKPTSPLKAMLAELSCSA